MRKQKEKTFGQGNMTQEKKLMTSFLNNLIQFKKICLFNKYFQKTKKESYLLIIPDTSE